MTTLIQVPKQSTPNTTYHLTMVGRDRVKIVQKNYSTQTLSLGELAALGAAVGLSADRRFALEQAFNFLVKHKR